MEDALFRGNREPMLDQILAEPIVRTMMRRDGIDETTIRELMRNVANAKRLGPAKIDFVPLVPPREDARSDLPQASLGVLAQAAAEPRWPRVFPGL